MGLARFMTRPAKSAPAESRTMAEFAAQFRASEPFGTGLYRGALGVPAVHRSATLIAGLLGSSPLHGFRDREGGPAERISPTPPLLHDPAAGMDTRFSVMFAWGLDYLLEGNAIGVVAARDSEGYPTAFVPVPACAVSVRPVDAGELYGLPQLGMMIEYQVGSKVYAPWDVLHVKGPHAPGALRGVGVLEAALGTVRHAQELETQSRGLAANGVPTGLLKVADSAAVTSPDELREAKRAWLDAQRTRTIAALAPGVEFQPIAWNAEELQLVEARKYSDVQIATLFGLPARYVNGEIGGLNYSTPAYDSQHLLAYTMQPVFVAFEHAFTQHMRDGEWSHFERDAVLATDTVTRYQAHSMAISAGWKEPNEVRAIEDLPPLPEVESSSPEVDRALALATAAPSLVQNPGLPALVDQLLVLNGKEPKNPIPPAEQALQSGTVPAAAEEVTSE